MPRINLDEIYTLEGLGTGVRLLDDGGEGYNILHRRWNSAQLEPDGETDFSSIFIDALSGIESMGSGRLIIPAGHYLLSEKLDVPSNCAIWLSPGARITQLVANQTIFMVELRENVHIHCNYAVLYGEGSWSDSWTGMSGHNDRGVQFRGCSNCSLHEPHIRNMANAGIAVLGGSNIRIRKAVIEGTHLLGVPLSSGNNYQVGIFVEHNSVFGTFSRVLVDAPEISYVAQGILTGNSAGAEGGLIRIDNADIHDVPGQHGMYLNQSDTIVNNPTIRNCNTSGLKWQATSATRRGLTVNGGDISFCGGQGIEISAITTGVLIGANVNGMAIRNCARGISLAGPIRDSQFNNFNISDITHGAGQYAVYLDEESHGALDNVEFNNLEISRVQQSAILNSAVGCTGVRFRNVTIREPNRANASDGVGIRHAGGDTLYENIRILDEDTLMRWGFYASTTGARFGGKLEISGAQTNPTRLDQQVNGWPTEANIGNVIPTGLANIRFDGDAVFYGQSTSATNVVPWRQTLDDNTTYVITAELVGILSGGAERGAYVSSVTVYRAGGAATIQGAATELSSHESASFPGVYSWSPTSNDIRLLVNSGGAETTINWRVKIRITRVAG